MANTTGFDNFAALLQQLKALLVAQHMAFLRTAQQIATVIPTTPAQPAADAATTIDIIPPTSAVTAQAPTILSPPPIMDYMGAIPIPPTVPPPTPANPFPPGSFKKK